MDIDPKIEEALASSPNEMVDVIICADEASDVIEKLREVGFHITRDQQAGMGLIYGALDGSCLNQVKSMVPIRSVTLDSEQHIL